MRFVLSIIFLGATAIMALAQELEQRCKLVPTGRSISLDTSTVIPESISISGNPDLKFEFQFNSSQLFVERGREMVDTVEVCFQVLPISFHKVYARRDYHAEVENQGGGKNQKPSADPFKISSHEQLLSSKSINTSGSLSRAVSFGNNQSVGVNSNLNLQLDGKISDNLSIRASISDNQLPYQPEGNTAQVQDLDNVFMEIFNDKFRLKAGDIVLQNGESTFLRYRKNARGGRVGAKYKFGKSEAESGFAVSLAKGKFATIPIDVQEGVAGPYRIKLPGTSSSNSIIIANSEKVHIDNQPLQRGYQYDYIIDYNKAEITFMPGVVITKYSRVFIDLEYADQSYARTIVSAEHTQKSKWLDFGFSYYSEKDNPNAPLLFDMNEDVYSVLEKSGDRLDSAYLPTYRIVDYNPNTIQYYLKDTLTESGSTVTVFERTEEFRDTVYQVNFSFVGPGNGDYEQGPTNTNGKVFVWVSTQNGQPSGSYAPLSRVEAPNKKQMLNVRAKVHLTQYDHFNIEWAHSNQDLNLVSSLDNEDNEGDAFDVHYSMRNRPVFKNGDYQLDALVGVEVLSENFTAIDRFRSVEFDRNWSYNPTTDTIAASDIFVKSGISLRNKRGNLVNYRFNKRNKGDVIDGYQHTIHLIQNVKQFRIHGDVFLAENNAQHRSNWSRWNLNVGFAFPKIMPGYQYSQDKNTIVNVRNDSVLGSANYFSEHQFYLQSSDSSKSKFKLSYALRDDGLPLGGEIVENDHSNTFTGQYSLNYGQGNSIIARAVYRELINKRMDDQNETNISGSLDWSSNFLKNSIRQDLSYNLGSSREFRREYVFLPVPPGQGTHTWRDFNEDGIQDLDEFILATNPDERNFAKFFVPTQDFVFAYANNFTYRLNMQLPSYWRNGNLFQRSIAKLSLNVSLSSQIKSTDESFSARVVPFANINEEDLISSRSNNRFRLFFNRSNPTFGIDGGLTNIRLKQFLIAGFDNRMEDIWDVNFRFNLRGKVNTFFKIFSGQVESTSDNLATKNFEFNYQRYEPEFSVQLGKKARIGSSFAYILKKGGTPELPSSADSKEVNLNVRYNHLAKQSLNAQLKFINIDFIGEANSPLGYEMLQGLQPGQNITWSLNWQKKIINGLNLNVIYFGRNSETSDTIHSGRMQVTALF